MTTVWNECADEASKEKWYEVAMNFLKQGVSVEIIAASMPFLPVEDLWKMEEDLDRVYTALKKIPTKKLTERDRRTIIKLLKRGISVEFVAEVYASSVREEEVRWMKVRLDEEKAEAAAAAAAAKEQCQQNETQTKAQNEAQDEIQTEAQNELTE